MLLVPKITSSLLLCFLTLTLAVEIDEYVDLSRPSRDDEAKPKTRGTPLLVKGSIKPGTFPDMENGKPVFCAIGEFVKEFRIKSEQHEYRGDDSAANAVMFKCTDGKELHSLEGPWGKWETIDNDCGGRAVGVELRVEDDHPIDNTGVNNIRLHCSPKEGNYVEGKYTRKWGTWRGMTDCPDDNRKCGFQTCVQKDQGRCTGCDDLALTGIQIFCCNQWEN